MSIDEKIACGINVVFGAAVGFAVYAIGLGGLFGWSRRAMHTGGMVGLLCSFASASAASLGIECTRIG